MHSSNSAISEKKLVTLLALVQFIHILDFMMVMPLGPDFAKSLNISASHLGIIGGSYTFAAAFSGLIGSFFLDRFDRRKALFLAMCGLTLGTFAGGLSVNFYTLVATRVIAGAFGGPANAIVYSIVGDLIPIERRGRAVGALMGAFSLSSILGVPCGLELARLGGWRLPFFAVGSLSLITMFSTFRILPPIREHLNNLQQFSFNSFLNLLRHPNTVRAHIGVGLLNAGSFLLVPNFSAFFQFNLGYPREHLGLLYMIGGGLSFFGMRLAGRMVDKRGSTFVLLIGTIGFVADLYCGFISSPPLIPTILIFVLLMLFNSARLVAVNALITKVPDAHERARFQSLQSSVQNFTCAIGSFAGASFLTSSSDGKLVGIRTLALTTLTTSFFVVVIIRSLEIRIRARLKT